MNGCGPVGSTGVDAPKDVELVLCPLTCHPLLLPETFHFIELVLHIAHGLVHEEFLESPFLNVPRLVFLEVVNVLDCAGEDGAFGFFTGTVWDDATQLVDSFVYVTSTTALDFFLVCLSEWGLDRAETKSYMIIFSLSTPLVAAHCRTPTRSRAARGGGWRGL